MCACIFIKIVLLFYSEIDTFLVYSSRTGIRGMSVSTQTSSSSVYPDVMVPILDSSMRSIYSGIDIDTQANYIYYSDVAKNMLFRIRPDGTGNEINST